MLYLQKDNIEFMWKEFFNFSKRERITIITLTVLILVVQVLIWTKDSWVRFLPENLEQTYQEKQQLIAYRDSVIAQKAKPLAQKSYSKKSFATVPIKLVNFNPNTADSSTLLGLGLRSYVVKNILNYRRKGGQFRKPSDFSRIYGLDAEVFAKLEPYIQMENKAEQKSETSPNAATVQSDVAKIELKASDPPKQAEPNPTQLKEPVPNAQTNFDLNSADTSMFQQLKGVGSVTANRIARYRSQLGGFYSLAQLSEIKGLYPETLTRLQSMLKIDPTRINTLNINKASLEKLRAHPYISFYQAKVIVELRKARGQIRSLDDLVSFKEFKPDDLERLKWYLSF